MDIYKSLKMSNLGRILKGIGGFYYVKFENTIFESKASALFRLKNIKLAVGDYVIFDINEDGTAYIKDIKERKNLFLRPPVANVDEVIIVVSGLQPEINYQLVDRMILLSRFNGVEPKIIINKIDLDMKLSKSIANDYAKAGFEVHLSSVFNEHTIDEIKDIISKKTIMFMGVSGVGKSSLISKLTNIDLEIGQVSNKTSRGKHTTRHIELLNYEEDSFIVDTPGFSSLSLDFVEDIFALKNLYTEFNENYVCKFSNCVHVKEPACGIKKALEDGLIEEFRYNNYIYFHNEVINRR